MGIEASIPKKTQNPVGEFHHQMHFRTSGIALQLGVLLWNYMGAIRVLFIVSQPLY